MRRAVLFVSAVLAALLAGGPAAFAQKATERFIPLGRSPGVSGVYSDMGRVESVDRGQQMVIAQSRGKRWYFMITPSTRIWLDRSRQRRSNLPGQFEDLRPGMIVEVKYADESKREAAKWVKVMPQ